MKRNPEHALEAIEAIQTWQTVAGLTAEESSTVVAALILLKQVVESVSQRTPLSTGEIVREIVDQCRVDGIIQLDRLMEAYQQMQPSAYGRQTSRVRSKLRAVMEEIENLGEDALAQLDIDTTVENALHRSGIYTISQLESLLRQRDVPKTHQMGEASWQQIHAALLKFYLSRRNSDSELSSDSSEGLA